jgi:NAD(P)-dependent dehydrogenase (short-subunit alcohol dehydrogenase family)
MSTLKIVIVTGGNKGIGRALCEQFLVQHSETFVYLGSRDKSRGEEAVESIVEKLGSATTSRIECLEMVSVVLYIIYLWYIV